MKTRGTGMWIAVTALAAAGVPLAMPTSYGPGTAGISRVNAARVGHQQLDCEDDRTHNSTVDDVTAAHVLRRLLMTSTARCAGDSP
jgi:alpha-D-ribose 1-methylphosphonate 5-phosphate C-P lyase